MLPISESDALEGELGSTAETTTQKKADSDTGALGGDARSTPGPSGTPGRSGASAYPDIAEILPKSLLEPQVPRTQWEHSPRTRKLVRRQLPAGRHRQRHFQQSKRFHKKTARLQ